MEIEIDSKRNNPLINRTEVYFTVRHDGMGTPNREIIRSELAAKLNVKKEDVVINNLQSSFGIRESTGYAKIYSSVEKAKEWERRHILERNKLVEKEEKKTKEEKKKSIEKPEGKPEKAEETKKEEKKTVEKPETAGETTKKEDKPLEKSLQKEEKPVDASKESPVKPLSVKEKSGNSEKKQGEQPVEKKE